MVGYQHMYHLFSYSIYFNDFCYIVALYSRSEDLDDNKI